MTRFADLLSRLHIGRDRLPRNTVGSIVVFVVVFSFLSFITGPTSPVMITRSTSSVSGRKQSASSQSTTTSSYDIQACPLKDPQIPKHKVTPTFLASYPGSGTRLSWEAAQAFTGLITGDDAFSNGQRNVVGIKTHYPAYLSREVPGAEAIPRVILFLRHPMDAIPAYHTHVYATETKQSPFEVQAPIESWVSWRDKYFANEIETWRKHLEYWMERYPSMNRLIISYEAFLSDEHGPKLASSMAEFLSRSEGVSTIPPEEIPCTWKSVKANASRNGLRRHLLRSKRRVQLEAEPENVQVPSFTKPQRKEMVIHLTQLLERYRDDKVLAPILVEFIDQVEQRMTDT